MILIGENVMDHNARSPLPAAQASYNYPRFYQASDASKRFFVILGLALLLTPLLSSDKYLRGFFFVCAILVILLYLAYAFGSKVTLHADKIKFQSGFIFKRLIRREHILGWQLQITETRSPVILLMLKSARKDVKDLVIEINFKMDQAFYAWFPKLQSLVEARCQQFPALQNIAG